MRYPVVCNKCNDIMLQQIKMAVAETKQAIMQNETIIAMAFKLMDTGNYTFNEAIELIRKEMSK